MIAARIAMSLHPASWRETHEDEVMATLLDLADDNGGRVPAGELVALAGRGAWLRIRSSVAFWGGILVLALMIWAQSRQFSGFVTEPSWNAVLSTSAGGFLVVLPIAGTLAAWSTATAASARERLRRALSIVATVLVGYAVTVIGIISASGWPASPHLDPAIPAAVVAFAVTAVSVGVIAGTLANRRIATVATLVVLGTWYLGVWTNYDIALRNLTGTNILLAPAGIDRDIPPQALVSVVLTALVVVAVAAIVAMTASRRGRVATVLAATLAGVVVLVATVSGPTRDEAMSVPRDTAELVCAGAQPSVCLWPEEEALNGAFQRPLIAEAAATAESVGVPVPAVLASGSDLGSLGSGTRTDSDRILNATAAALVLPWRDDAGSANDHLAVTYALALLFGADSVAVQPGMSVVSRTTFVEHRLTPDEVQDELGVHSTTEARELVAAWLAGELTGLRAPS